MAAGEETDREASSQLHPLSLLNSISMEGAKDLSDLDRLIKPPSSAAAAPSASSDLSDNDGGLPITCFSEVLNDVSLHFQIIRFPNQIYAWIGCNSTKFGQFYAAAPTRPNNAVSVTSILGGTSDNTGSGIAHRLALKTGLNIVFASNIPKNNTKLEADAEKLLVQKLVNLGYTRPKSGVPS